MKPIVTVTSPVSEPSPKVASQPSLQSVDRRPSNDKNQAKNDEARKNDSSVSGNRNSSSSGNRFLSLGKTPSISTPVSAKSPESEGNLSVRSVVLQRGGSNGAADKLRNLRLSNTDNDTKETGSDEMEESSICCKSCGKAIINEDILRADDKSPYHVNCFRCCVRI